MEGLLDDIFHMSSFVHHVGVFQGSSDFHARIEKEVPLSDARDEMINRVSTVITQVCSM